MLQRLAKHMQSNGLAKDEQPQAVVEQDRECAAQIEAHNRARPRDFV